MTKIFITIPWFIPAFRAGGPIQSIANMVKEYNTNIEYFIFCSDTDINGGALENIIANEWTNYNAYTKVWYAGPEKISDHLVTQVESIKPDVLYIIGLYDWHFNIVPILFCKVAQKIISARGMLHPGALSQKKIKKKIYVQIFKLFEYHHKVIFHATDEQEGMYIRQQYGKVARISIAGNFPNKLEVLSSLKKEKRKLCIISIALISPMKNILLVLQSLKKVNAEISYDIFGPVKDNGYWNECVEAIKLLPENIIVRKYEAIPPGEVKMALQNSHVFILPSKSENFGHAIYEALSAGRPVITSRFVPWLHLKESNAGINVSIDNEQELTKAIQFFADMNEEEFSNWHYGAAKYANNAINFTELRNQYNQMFFKVI